LFPAMTLDQVDQVCSTLSRAVEEEAAHGARRQ
jgi:hypothetical protein